MFNGEKIRLGNLVTLIHARGRRSSHASRSALSHWPSEIQQTFYSGSAHAHDRLQISWLFRNSCLPAWYHFHLIAIELLYHSVDLSQGSTEDGNLHFGTLSQTRKVTEKARDRTEA